MAEEDIRRYTIEELRAMNERDEFKPALPDAATIDFDEDFWRELETMRALPTGSEIIELVLPQATIDSFAAQNHDYLAEMAHVLDAFAAAKAKKAS